MGRSSGFHKRALPRSWAAAPNLGRVLYQAGCVFLLCAFTTCNRRIGIKHWIEYIQITKGSHATAFPVAVDDVLAWSMTFRCIGTFANYLGYLRSACCALGQQPPPVGHPAIKRAMTAIGKRMLFSPRCALSLCLRFACGVRDGRPKLAIQRTTLRNMALKVTDKRHAALWIVAYTWLLRLPSEVFPVS